MLHDMHQMKNTAIIVAAGSGSRLGSEVPKQFLTLNGQEILSYSVSTFLEHSDISDVIIVTSQAFLGQVRSKYPECQVVLGGATRQDSVYNGLQACGSTTTHVLVHDAARPLLPATIIDRCLHALTTHDGVAPAIKPVDSMVRLLDDDFQSLKRAELRIVQTPQCFPIDILLKAHASRLVDTDEMGLVKQALPDVSLRFIEGAQETIKITQPADIETAKIFLRATQA